MKKSTLMIMVTTILFSCLSYATDITHLVVFGDSLSDRGYSSDGGFNRYSNGPVWPEYLAEGLCKSCLQDCAWGGAKTGVGNYNGFNWSGILWQINRYHINTPVDKTLFIIWGGGNDIIDGSKNGILAATHIFQAVKQLHAKGAKHIVVLTLPDFTLVPAYNNKYLKEYAHFSPFKKTVKEQTLILNRHLTDYFQKNKHHLDVDLIDAYFFFDQATSLSHYKNTLDPWFGTYTYPDPHGYMWWDAFHPMTNVHRRIATFILKELNKRGYVMK